MTRTDEAAGAAGYSRRRFLGKLGVAAGGVVAPGVLGPESAGADDHERDEREDRRSRSDRFGRMFPGLKPFAEATPAVTAALNAFGAKDGPIDARDDMTKSPLELILEPGGNLDSTIPAGMTFLGQFVDHDVTFDLTSPLGVPTSPEKTRNFREPALNLDSVYGGGYGDTRFVLPDGRMRVERCDAANSSSREDLPRVDGKAAVIADPRNDENLIISALHAAVLSFHNNALEHVKGNDARQRFNRAQRLTRWHYQWIVLHELLPAFVGPELVDLILRKGRRFYRPSGEAFIPVEFQIAYRLHSLARPSYRVNFTSANGQPLFLFLFDPSQNGATDPNDLRGGQRSPRRFIDWQTFFGFPGLGFPIMRTTKKLDRLLSTPLFTLPMGAVATGEPPFVLAQRNLLRHLTWGIPSGQRIAEEMGVEPLGRRDLEELKPFGQELDRSTPLWHYVNAEAELLGNGDRLGSVGGRIVAEVLIGLLELDASSFLSERNWRPTLPAKYSPSGEFRMIDFLAFAGVAPS